MTATLFVLVLLLGCRFSGWVLESDVSGQTVGLPPTLRPLHGALNPNTSSLPHLAGWYRRPDSSSRYSWRIDRALAGAVTPCHDDTRDYQQHPVRLREPSGYSMTRLQHEAAGEVQSCAIPCVRVTGMAFRPLALGAMVCGAALLASVAALYARVAARSTHLTRTKAKADPPVRLGVPRNASHRRNKVGQREQSAGSITLWLPPVLLFGCAGLYTGHRLLDAWRNRADASPTNSFALLAEDCGWYWTSTMENHGDTAAQMMELSPHTPTIVSSTMLASDVPVPYSEPQLLDQIYGAKLAAEIKQSFDSRSKSVALAAAFISNCGPGAPQLERLRW